MAATMIASGLASVINATSPLFGVAFLAVAGMEALAKNGLRYPFPQYGIQQDVRDGMARSYPDRAATIELLVNAKVERPWQDLVNQRLAAAADRHSNAVLVDWHGLSEDHPEWFAPDGAHLRPAGARAYAELIRSHL